MTFMVLTVGDSRTIGDMLRLALMSTGVNVMQAEDGLHGAEVLATESVANKKVRNARTTGWIAKSFEPEELVSVVKHVKTRWM